MQSSQQFDDRRRGAEARRIALSIIIVNWNSKDYLLKALAAIDAEREDSEREIIVIDSGSFDGSGEVVRQQYPKVSFIQSEENLGFAKANNQAFKTSRGETILFLNPDTEVQDDAVDQLTVHLTTSPEIGIVGPKLLNTDRSIQEVCIRAFPTMLNQILDSDILKKLFPKAGLWGMKNLNDKAAGRVEAVSGACLMIRRKVFEQVGMFSQDYFMYSEDMDLCFKAKQAGFQTHYVPSAVVVHHGGSSSSRAAVSAFASVMMLESRWKFFRRTRSPTYAAIYRVAMFAASIIRIGLSLCAWPVLLLLGKGYRSEAALQKWYAGLRWTLGMERWVKKYETRSS